MQPDRVHLYLYRGLFVIFAVSAIVQVADLLFDLFAGNVIEPSSVGGSLFTVAFLPNVVLVLLDKSLLSVGVPFAQQNLSAEERFNRILLFSCANWCLATVILVNAVLSDPAHAGLFSPSVSAALAVILYGCTIYSLIRGYNAMRKSVRVEPN